MSVQASVPDEPADKDPDGNADHGNGGKQQAVRDTERDEDHPADETSACRRRRREERSKVRPPSLTAHR